MYRKLMVFGVITLSLLLTLYIFGCKKKEEKEEVTTEEETTEEVVEEPTEEIEEGYITVEQREKIGNYIIFVKGYERLNEIDGIKAKKDKKLVKVDLTASYAQNTMWFISTNLAFRLVLPDNTELEPIKYTGKDAFTEGGIQPGGKASGAIVFEAPVEAKDLKLKCDFTVQNQGKAIIPLKAKEQPVV